MLCQDAKKQLQQSGGDLKQVSDAVDAHLQECPSCQAYAEELYLSDLLTDLPAAPMREGFTDRVLEQAWEASEQKRSGGMHAGRWLATAATLLLAVFIGMQLPFDNTQPQAVQHQLVQFIPDSQQTLDIVFTSGKDYPDATIEVVLESGVQFSGLSDDQQTLAWDAAIANGNNLLSLPITLLPNKDARMRVTVSSGGASKALNISLKQVASGQYALSIISEERGLS